MHPQTTFVKGDIVYKRKIVTQETAFNYVNDDEHEALFTSNERKWINRIYRLKKENPDDIQILQTPDKNNGYLIAEIPKNYFTLRKPKPKA